MVENSSKLVLQNRLFSAAGIAALNTLKQLVGYAHPDHLTQASNETQAIWEAGEAAPRNYVGF